MDFLAPFDIYKISYCQWQQSTLVDFRSLTSKIHLIFVKKLFQYEKRAKNCPKSGQNLDKNGAKVWTKSGKIWKNQVKIKNVAKVWPKIQPKCGLNVALKQILFTEMVEAIFKFLVQLNQFTRCKLNVQ